MSQPTKRGRAAAAASSTAEDPAREAWSLIVRLFQCGKASTMASCAEFDLSAAQAYLLQTLDPSKPVPMSSLAGALSCDASNVTGLVDKLEARGFVERQPDPNDRRVKMIALTASGKRVRAEVVERLATPPASVEALSKTDQEDLVRILKKAVAPPLGRAAGAE